MSNQSVNQLLLPFFTLKNQAPVFIHIWRSTPQVLHSQTCEVSISWYLGYRYRVRINEWKLLETKEHISTVILVCCLVSFLSITAIWAKYVILLSNFEDSTEAYLLSRHLSGQLLRWQHASPWPYVLELSRHCWGVPRSLAMYDGEQVSWSHTRSCCSFAY